MIGLIIVHDILVVALRVLPARGLGEAVVMLLSLLVAALAVLVVGAGACVVGEGEGCHSGCD
jgi:hypothetical protein